MALIRVDGGLHVHVYQVRAGDHLHTLLRVFRGLDQPVSEPTGDRYGSLSQLSVNPAAASCQLFVVLKDSRLESPL